ncbi:autotransporter-associated N-terminal domain-containing protein [Fusobacterium ulcerans]|uniref:autotransporter-associated N-terminal domain-containing protein n=1 Tax=Fusobacterium ulcerans TaxID=861 RepID=UPI00103067D0|nr:autotransporter-associated N-terminal domain-containing protein [Fusobacterium ulcerans]
MRKNDIEKSLKRFLKRKVSYSLSLLIAFMITGGISLGAGITAEEIQETKSDLLTRIQTEREEIKRKIAENERLIKEYNSDFVELVRKGDFYSKPLFNSTQVFLSYQYLDSGKMKDRTDKEFAETIDAINKHYGTRSGRSLFRSSGNIGKDKIMAGNGVAVDNEVFREEINLGANIIPVEPILPEVNPEVSINISEPTVNLGALPGTVNISPITISTVTPPTVVPPSAPVGILLTVTTPDAVDKIAVSTPVIIPTTTPSDKEITVTAPTAPGGYDPSYISVPEAPSSPVISLPSMPSINFVSMSNGNGAYVEVDAVPGGAGSSARIQNGIISAVSVIDGTFMVKREILTPYGITTAGGSYGTATTTANNSFRYSYSNYKAYAFAKVGAIGVGANSAAGSIVNAGTVGDKYAISYANAYADSASVQRIVGGQALTFNNGKFRVARESDSSTVYLGEFLHMDIHASIAHGTIRTHLVNTVDKIASDGAGATAATAAVLPAWDDVIANYTTNTARAIAWVNSNDIALEGGNLNLTNMYHHTSALTSGIVINTGKIQIRPYKSGGTIYDGYNSVFVVSSEQQANKAQYVMYNKGEINTSTQNTGVFTINNGWYRRGGATTYCNSSENFVVNKGVIEMTGKHSIGVYGQFLSWNVSGASRGVLQMDFMDGTDRKPIQLYGDESIGLYVLSEFNSSNITGNFHVDIGGINTGNKSISIDENDTNGGESITDYWSGNTSTNTVDGSVGILSYRDINLTSHGIVIHDKTNGNIGVAPQKKAAYTWSFTGGGQTSNWAITAANPNLNLGSGYIKINGGTNNIGIFAREGNVTTTGSVDLTDGTGNLAIYAKDYTAGVGKVTTTGNVANTVILFADNGTINVTNNVKLLGLKVTGATTGNQNNILAAYASNTGTISMNNSGIIGSLTSPDIEVTGMELGDASGQYRGLALMADNGVINGKNNYIKVVNGAAGVASINSGNIDISGSTIYVNNGYAVYSDGTGTVNLTNGKLVLDGNSVAFDLDFNLANPLTLTGSEIHIVSDDVTAVNLKNVSTALSVNNLKSSIITALGGAINITDDGIHDKYKIAAVDGGTLNIDTNIDKADPDPDSNGYFYYKRFLGQRLKLNVTGGIEVNAAINSAEATAYFKGQVVGLEMNSSSSASGVSDTQINLATGSKVIADRTDSGAGAIGLYMNFGEIKLDAGSKVEVEKGSNVVNNEAVGVYAVNGSKVDNAGTIEVGGNRSIGILGMAYREAPIGTVIVNEFGASLTDQGKVNIINDKNITLDGIGTIGIYAHNNKASGLNTDAVVTNTVNGVITVGSSDSSNAAVGIYGKKATISNLGKISVGDGGVAIYATEGSRITDLGILDLGADGVGVMADGTSDISATSVTLTSNNAGILGKTGIFYKGDLGTESKTIGVAVNASALDKGTAIYVENMNITSSGILNIGKEGVGIFVKGNSTQTGTNTGTIDLTSGKTGAVGMYTKTANIINDIAGIIEVRDSSQIGMYAEGTNNKATNIGAIKLNVDGSTGIYVKSGAIAELNTGNNITFAGKSSVGVFAENAAVNLKSNLTFLNNNENKNIYVYGKDATVGIDAGKTVTIDGMGTPTTAGNKTVGIYLENAGTGSTFNGATGQVVVTNEAVGIYSKGNNTLNVNVTADGVKTTGVFIEDGSSITGTVTARGASGAGAVGVYGSKGAVTIGAVGLTLKTDTDKGTGMYLADGAYASGGKITINNTAAVDNIGVYYSKGTASGTVTNGSEIELTGNKSIGIYAADGINLVNTKNINSTTSNNIASYVGGNSTLTSNGNITMTGTDNIGIYTGKGTGVNAGTINLTGAAGTSSAGMAAKTDVAGDIATVENKNIIIVGNNLGMYVAGAGTSSGKNTGTITATTGTGVYVDGGGNSFDGTGGSITSNAVGIYLKDTDANKITAGTLNIGSGGVGVFGENAKIDFAVNVAGTGAVGVAAKNGSVISGNVTTGQDSVGAYLLDSTVTFNGANITTGTNNSGTSVGVLFDAGITGTYTMNNVSVNAKNGVGIYLGGVGMTLNHNGTVTTEGGIGIYVKNGTTLTTGTSTLNISNGGTGIYVEQGTANLGLSGNLAFNFGTGGGIGIYNNGGTLNIGSNITLSGSGSLAATTDGSFISSGNITVGEGGTGLLGQYSSSSIAVQSITNSGIITASSGGIGLAAVKAGAGVPGAAITVNNFNTITISGKSSGTSEPSIGIYTDIADVVNTGNINVGTDGIGIYSIHNGVLTSVQNDNMKMTGTDGIGVYLKGATSGLLSNSITSTGGTGNTGVILEDIGTIAINAGTITLGEAGVGVVATGTTTSTITGSISVGDSNAIKSAIGIVADNGANITLAGATTITAGNGGIGVYAEGAGTTITVPNAANINVGANGVYMYSNGANLSFAGNITANNKIGLVADGGTVTSTGATINVQNGGLGVFVKNAAPVFTGTPINVQAGNSSQYSIGAYYDEVSSIGTAPVITQTGSYTIGMVLNDSTGTTAGGISIGGSGSINQIGAMAKKGSNLTINGNVLVDGNENIGVYGEDSLIRTIGSITVLDSSTCVNKSTSSIGVSINGGSYIGNGNLSVGNYSIGVFGKDMTVGSVITQGTGIEIMTVGNNGLGIYGEGTGGTITADMSNITVGTDNAIGVYAKGMNSVVTGNMGIGANTSIGIASEGNGNVAYTGTMTIANKASTASVGIYKTDGTGIISTSAGSWSVGENGYGIYLKQTKGHSATITNNADMNLQMAAVGIFSSGENIVSNSGNIIVGSTNVNGDHANLEKHENSIGIYLNGGSTGINTSSGVITINHDHSVGVYVAGSTTSFTNEGTINVDNGGIGILVQDKGTAENKGTINLGNTLAACKSPTVGMAAYGGAKIINSLSGVINVNEGTGMYVNTGAELINKGTINVLNGIGIEGNGKVTNSGLITVTGTGTDRSTSGVGAANVGAIEIDSAGNIKINDKYVSVGGTLTTDGILIIDGAYVDVTTGIPLFSASSVSGEVNIMSNFATTGNGITYLMKNFVNTAAGTVTGNKLVPVTSPLFVAKVTSNGDLAIAKRPYADIVIGEQFDALHKGLDNILENSGGNGRDAEILKKLNAYLNDFSGEDFEREASRTLAETRGDIYATIQSRMQDINQAFDNSFYELESSYNLTKDSSKYSVIYTDGKYRDSTLGIDEYDYKVMGLLYMKEKEGAEYGSKYGYTIGFAGSKFDFDDGGSKEDVYSLRVGAHRVKNLSEEHKVSWLSRIELGYNRHIAKRKLELDTTYENKGEYNTYSVALDNRLTKVIYTDLSRQLDVYADLDLEYGKVDDFKESAGSKGGLEVQIKDNDYLSAQTGAGVKASQRIYAGNDISVKVTADVKYAYEFGDNYDGNKARLKNGEEGYYSLITPEEREGKLTGKVGLTIEKANHMGVTFEVEAADENHKKDSSIKYGVRFNYKF